jgi:Phage integrase family
MPSRARPLEEVGLRESRLYDARHTAATVLLLLEVPLRSVMSNMGWSSVEMAARYQHITDAIRQKVAGQVGQVIWQTTSAADSTGLVTVRREALAVILPVVDIGLDTVATRPSPTWRMPSRTSGLPWRTRLPRAARARSQNAIETGDPADP